MNFKKTITVFLLALSCMLSVEASMWEKVKTFWNGNEDGDVNIKVLVADRVDSVNLEIRGGYNIYDPGSNSKVGARFFGKTNTVLPLEQGLKWGEEFPGIYQLSFIPDNPATDILVNGVRYEGNVQLFQIGNKISVVNELYIEDYLKSSISKNILEHKQEASSAMVIAARTEAYYHVSRGSHSFWHVDGSKIGFHGAVDIDDSVADLVEGTRDIVMIRDSSYDKYFAARWTENSAGKTAPFSLMFRQDMGAPEKGVTSPWAMQNRSDSKWSSVINRNELADNIGAREISDIEVYRDEFSGKVYNLRMKTDAGYKDLSFLDLQDAFGPENIISSDFSFNLEGENLILQGYGKGHGVGMCLYTADVLADKGSNAAQILRTFFPDADVVRRKA